VGQERQVTLLFVCSGNICRSPMAAGYFERRAGRAALAGTRVASAGTLGIEGQSASPEAIQVMREIGVDLTRHRSRGLDAHEVATCDLLVAMTAAHLHELSRRFSDAGGPRLLLRAFEDGPRPASGAGDLDDPISRPLAFYRTQRAQIVRCVDHLVEFLRGRP
jgi:protein-tyrosine-phosphatase